jgi:hypothetical protein
MTLFTFPRVSAGVYDVQKNSNTVGRICKQTASKWIVSDLAGTPQHVSKTLKEAKDACVGLIIFNDNQTVDKSEESDYNHSVRVEDQIVDSLELQRQMLASMKIFRVNENGDYVEVIKDPVVV